MRLSWPILGAMCVWATMSGAQEFNVNNLVFHGVNKFLEKEQDEGLNSIGMGGQLSALRLRVLTAPATEPVELPADRFYDVATEVALRYEIPPQIFFNLITVESNWDPVVMSYRGAIGLTQLMPATAQELGVNPWNAKQNLEGGARYLRQQHNEFGSWLLALAAYNSGPGTVKKYGGVPPYEETQEYVQKILGL